MPSILFVCTANICRSPMAEAIFKYRLAALPDAAHWRVGSAGTWATDGYPADPTVRQVLREMGIALGEHRSRLVDRDLLQNQDLILVMTHSHKEALRAEFPQIAKRLYLLSEMVGPAYDLTDPYGGYLSDFRETAAEIDQILTRGLDHILALASQNVSAG